jgi:hypothetical protein
MKRIIGADRDEVLADLELVGKRHGMTYRARYLSRVDVRGPDDCWLWLGGVNQDGHGVAWIGGYSHKPYAHQIAYVIHNGPIPEGMIVRHSCDVPRCQNPAHLLIGTHKDNTADKIQNGRSNMKGKRRFAFTDEQVLELRKRRQAGERIDHIARSIGEERTLTGNAIRGKTYKHVTLEEQSA